MTQKEFNFIKDSFSQIIDDIAGNPDWGKASEAVASDLGTLERVLKKTVVTRPSNLDEAAEEYERNLGYYECMNQWPSVAFKAGAKWMAEQGVSVKGLLYGGSLGIPDIPEEFYTDKEEEVIVQIRKK